MIIIHINKLINLNTSDKRPMIYVYGEIIQSDFELGVQPKSIAYLEESNNYKEGQNITLDDDSMPLSMLQIENKDPWELYGSDHNSGILWFGNSEKMNEIYKKIEDAYLNHVSSLSLSSLTDESIHISGSPIVRWDFNDGNSLIISYIDSVYHQMPNITEIHAKEIISYEFGAGSDDRLAHEFLQPYVARLLKKIKSPNMELELDDLDDEDDYPITVNGQIITSKHNEIILKLAEHLYCSILKQHESSTNNGEYSDELNEAIAKKLEKKSIINNLEKPISDASSHLTYIYNTSNKEYNIHFKKDNNAWVVTTSYGSIGKKLKKDIQISTSNIEEAQQVYLALLKDKLTKGYDLIKSPQLNIQNNKIK